MRIVVGLALGLLIGRQLYSHFDKERLLKKEEKIKKRVRAFLEENGLTPNEAGEQTKELFD